MQPTNSGHWKRTRSCSSIQYERSRPRKNGCAGFRMAKNYQTSESKDRKSYGHRLHVNFPRRAVAARENAINNPPPVVSKPSASSKSGSDDQAKVATPAPKKDGRSASVKKALKGVIMRKKPKGEPSLAPSPASTPVAKHGDDVSRAKRRKISTV